MPTRRGVCRLLGTVVGLVLSGPKMFGTAVSKLVVDSLLADSQVALPDPAIRHYRVDVVVTLLGVPIFSRKAIGAAFASFREAAPGDRKIVALQFAGGANPERTHGFKYDGSMEEAIVERGSTRPQAAYFGFVTHSSKDENFDQARQRVMNKTKPAGGYTAAQGVHTAGSARCEKSSVSLPDQRRDLPELIQKIREGFHDSDHVATELHTSGDSAASTFLYSVLTALRSPESHSQIGYVHNATEYRLDWERATDQRDGSATTRFTGRILSASAHRISTFRLWHDNQTYLPLRIEFQPRSYLRLNLECEPAEARSNEIRSEET